MTLSWGPDYSGKPVSTNSRAIGQTLKRILPPPVRAALRRLLYPGRFHLHPALSRYSGPESVVTWGLHEAGFHLWRHTLGRSTCLKQPIFMIGCSRSGTTIAAALFGLHPDVADFSEAHPIWDPRGYRDPEADHYWVAADVRAEDAARLHARFEYVRRHLGKERFFNKNPRSSVRIDYIRAVFPDAVFIHVIRDGRAVAASMLEFIRARAHLESVPMPLCRPPSWRELLRADKLEQVALQWREVVSFILKKRAELGPAYHEFKYEELCDDPRRVLAATWRFAGLRVEADVLERLPERLESQNYKWREQLNPEQIELVTGIQRSLLEEMAYPL